MPLYGQHTSKIKWDSRLFHESTSSAFCTNLHAFMYISLGDYSNNEVRCNVLQGKKTKSWAQFFLTCSNFPSNNSNCILPENTKSFLDDFNTYFSRIGLSRYWRGRYLQKPTLRKSSTRDVSLNCQVDKAGSAKCFRTGMLFKNIFQYTQVRERRTIRSCQASSHVSPNNQHWDDFP